jgi:hypothetical protein
MIFDTAIKVSPDDDKSDCFDLKGQRVSNLRPETTRFFLGQKNLHLTK